MEKTTIKKTMERKPLSKEKALFFKIHFSKKTSPLTEKPYFLKKTSKKPTSEKVHAK